MQAVRSWVLVCCALLLASCDFPEKVLVYNESNYPVVLSYMPMKEVSAGTSSTQSLQPKQKITYYLYQFMFPPDFHERFIISRQGVQSTYVMPEVVDVYEFLDKFSHGKRFSGVIYHLKIDQKHMYIQDSQDRWLILKTI